jgi:2-polyprenyl-3-methyl-5-hydroxy-6-metoxy-1,4-benzoquinol methylase
VQNATRYYHYVRRNIKPLLPKNASRILDIGAGGGVTLGWLKTVYPDATTTGLELNADLENELKQNADVAIIGNIDECVDRLGKFDLILLLDVLEHIPDSTGTLQKISRLLQPDGCVIVSVPNIAHLSVTLPLLMQRRFTYRDAGIMDRTHLKFFVEDTAVQLLNDAGLLVTKGLIIGPKERKAKLLDMLSLGALRHHVTKQYIMRGEPRDGGIDQRRVRWEIGD